MAFNKKVSGFRNEYEFRDYLNGKTINTVHPIFEELLSYLFKGVNRNSMIYCEVNNLKQKFDLIITIESYTKRISVKKGVKNSVHVEHINDFISFLKDNGASNYLIKQILLFQYADGTTNGKGTERLNSHDYNSKNIDSINQINCFFNRDDVIKNATERFVIKGNNSNEEIDAIIYGVVSDFIWITKDEIFNIILKHKNISKNSLAFSSLFYQPFCRCLNYNRENEWRRYYIQIKWYHLSDDIIEVMCSRNGRAIID